MSELNDISGDVKYKHHHGHETGESFEKYSGSRSDTDTPQGSDWAAKVKVAKEGDEYKVALYQIIVVSQVNPRPNLGQ